MIKICLPVMFVLVMVGCGPKNEEVTTEQIETAPQSEVLDSVTDARKDGVLTDEVADSPALLQADSMP
ncbi:hypothetical protein [Pontibacter burrus]|uniref:Uncharacterized protein n=1 Tax=Pontibacter burrus TaxID=2704466 RepID=A0A6B3LUG6_9BACT|nr:hypothetical protein [Pontibacter burrus]NEM97111.1 hypothetical protein [Pontibacter burrus]